MTDLRQAAKAVVDRWDSPAWEWSQQGPTADLIAALRKALAQPEQEPVAWMRPSNDGYDSAFRDHSTKIKCAGNPWTGWVPLYTTPPAAQRPWVGLEIEQVQDSYNSDYQAQTRAVEKLLKERNT